jgi:crotonobetainyl-CoA:carnitine CoA-transferase CaiB-like acyl-CoA transferase
MASVPNVLGPVFVEHRAPDCKRERTWGGSAFYQIYGTRDGRHVVLGAQEMKFVRNLLTALGREDFIPLCERGPGTHQQPLIDYLRTLFATRTQAEWIAWFDGKDIAFAPVKNLREAFDDPQTLSRAMVLRDAQGHEHVGTPIKFAREPAQLSLLLPELGADNSRIGLD